jgi:tripartite-type tricarboxylate transporter receptor subunit TctC
MAGVDLVTVQYRDPGPAHTDLLARHVDILFDPLISSIEQIKSGQLYGLAVTTMTRSEALPNVPAVSEFVTGYEASVWSALGAPRNTPTEIINKLNSETNAALADPKIKARLSNIGATALFGSPSDFRKFIVEDTEKWSKVIRTANIKAE